MSELRRGDVWRVCSDPTIGSETRKTRPCVIVQRDAANATSPVTIICPMTDARGGRVNVLNVSVAARQGGLDKESLVACNQVRVVDRSRLRERLGTLLPETMQAIDRGLRAILDL